MARCWAVDLSDSYSSSHPTVDDPSGFARSTLVLERISLGGWDDANGSYLKKGAEAAWTGQKRCRNTASNLEMHNGVNAVVEIVKENYQDTAIP